jgi:hypothetical protein
MHLQTASNVSFAGQKSLNLTGVLCCSDRKVKYAEAKALLAEKQLEALNGYMAKATHAYQIEIMRLKKLVSQDSKARGKP